MQFSVQIQYREANAERRRSAFGVRRLAFASGIHRSVYDTDSIA